MLGLKEANLPGRAAATLTTLHHRRDARDRPRCFRRRRYQRPDLRLRLWLRKAGVFPVKGKHTYGDGLGAGRGHQGQDLLAKCGKPIVAAQPGKVKVKDYQAGGAGNYVVVKGKGPALRLRLHAHAEEARRARR